MIAAKKLLYIFTHAPYSNAQGQEGLDAVLIGASFEQDISVLFLHDGVFQLLSNQNTDSTIKQYTKTFKALPDFGVDNVYVHAASMSSRGLSKADLSLETDVISNSSIQALIVEQFRVFTF